MHSILLRGEIDVNCYFLVRNNQCYVVDPGYERERVRAYVAEQGWEVLGILLTHAHIDHIGAIDAFKVPVFLHAAEFEILEDNYKNGFEYYQRQKPYNLSDINVVTFTDGKTFPLGDALIGTIFVPGHTVGGVCYRLGNDLYTGDVLFQGAVGRWDFPTGEIETLKQSVVKLIDSLPDNVRVYPAHGPSTTIGQERLYNFYYRAWKRELG